MGVSEPSSATFEMPGLLLARIDGGRLVYVGKVGLPAAPMAAVKQVLPLLARRTSPCRGAGRAHTFLEPGLVVEVRFLTWTGAGLLRQPVFLRFRPGKPWGSCSVGP